MQQHSVLRRVSEKGSGEGLSEGFWKEGPDKGFTVKTGSEKGSLKGFWEGVARRFLECPLREYDPSGVRPIYVCRLSQPPSLWLLLTLRNMFPVMLSHPNLRESPSTIAIMNRTSRWTSGWTFRCGIHSGYVAFFCSLKRASSTITLVRRIAAFAFAFAMAIPRCQWRHRCIVTFGKFPVVLYTKPLWRKENGSKGGKAMCAM